MFDMPATEVGELTRPSQSLLSAHNRAMKALFPARGAPVTICTGMSTIVRSAFLAAADRQAERLQFPVQVRTLDAGPLCHT